MILMHKCVKDGKENPPSKLFTLFKTRKALNEDLAISKPIIEQSKRSVIFSSPKIWNKINAESMLNHIKDMLPQNENF